MQAMLPATLQSTEMTNTASPKSANLPELSAIPVPVDYSQPTGLALMLADMIVSSRKTAAYLRQISTADFLSGTYSFPTPADYVAAPYRLPMLEPATWNVVADIITAYQPVEVYQIGSSTDLIQSTFPIIINPTDYANPANEDEPIKPFAVGQSVMIRVYKVASAGINWAGSNIVNNGLTDEAIKSLTQITMVVTNIAGTYTVTDWLGVDFITNGMSSLKTSAKGNFAAVVNELFDAIAAKTATGPAGGDLTGNYPNPTIGTGKVVTDKIAAGAVTAAKMAEGVIPTKLPTPAALTFTGGATGSFDGSAAKTVNIPTTLPASDVSAWAKAPNKPTYNFDEIQDAQEVNGAAGTIRRRVIVYGRTTDKGYRTRVGVGVQYGTSNFGSGVFSVGNNEGGTSFVDYIFGSNGNMNIPGGYYTYSDERLKDFLGDLRVDWDAIKALPKKYYRLKDDEQDTRRIGTSAQELLKSYPEVVEKDADGMYRVDYAKLSIIALAAVSELEERISNLESKISKSWQ